MPIHFHSRNFKRAYKKRTGVERFFSRIDNVHGFEHAIVASRSRVRIRIALTLVATLAAARSRILAQKPQRMRSMRQAARFFPSLSNRSHSHKLNDRQSRFRDPNRGRNDLI